MHSKSDLLSLSGRIMIATRTWQVHRVSSKEYGVFRVFVKINIHTCITCMYVYIRPVCCVLLYVVCSMCCIWVCRMWMVHGIQGPIKSSATGPFKFKAVHFIAVDKHAWSTTQPVNQSGGANFSINVQFFRFTAGTMVQMDYWHCAEIL